MENTVSSDRLWTRNFIALLVTQFLVALNDNIFRWLVIPIGKYAIGWSDTPDKVRMIGSVAFLLPFILFTAYAGYCCDRFNRRTVIIWCKVAEVLILILGTMAILCQSVFMMLVVLFLLATQSAFFSPAKYSSLPAVVPQSLISKANGFYSMTTMIACIGGQLLGGYLFVWTTVYQNDLPVLGQGGMSNWWLWASVLLGVAVLGLISSFFIPSIPASDLKARFPFNPLSNTFHDLRFLFRHRFVFWVAMGSSLFWGFGALAQINIDKFATEMLFVRQDDAMTLLVALTLGLAFGSFLAGLWSRGKVDLGLIPIGTFFIVLFCLFLSWTPEVMIPTGKNIAGMTTPGFIYAGVGLFLLGTSAGMYDVPLLAMIQVKSPPENRGRILAAYNFYSFMMMTVFSIFQGILAKPPAFLHFPRGLNAQDIWFVGGLIFTPVFFIVLAKQMLPFLSVLVTAFFRIVYRPRIIDPGNIPEDGPVLLVSNHVSYLDALLIYCYCRRPVRFIADDNFVPRNKFVRYIARKTGAILIEPGNRRTIVGMIREARAALAQGDVVCIFPEGGLSRNGQIKSFEPGFLSLLKGHEETPVVPVFIGGFFGSYWGYMPDPEPRSFFNRLYQQVTVAFGKPFRLTENGQTKTVQQIQHIVEELGVNAMDPDRFPKDRHYIIPVRAMLRNCRRYPNETRLLDSLGTQVTGRQLLLKTLVLQRLIKRYFKEDKMIGLLLPTSVGSVLANVSVTLAKKIPININYTFSNNTNNYCLEMTGIKHVITTNKLLNRLPNLNLNTNLVIIEDILTRIPTLDKITGFIESLLPIWILERILGLNKVTLQDINTIVFTSGSTGLPKGVVLTNKNIASNIQGFYQFVRPKPTERLYGSLPLFHSFGYTTTVWFPVSYKTSCVYHFNPLDPKSIGETARKYRPTIMISTPTFYRNYYRRCPREDFESLNLVVSGAEKLSPALSHEWREKYGSWLVEGFGATEIAPVLGVNLPPNRCYDTTFAKYYREGSIGRPCPGFAVRVTDLNTGEELPPDTPGMLEVKGLSVMQGYYQEPEKTAQVFHDGWYITGDIAKIDEDGFIFITGRQSRISKIGGEMVPHILIEEQLEKCIDELERQNADNGQSKTSETELKIAVTAVPDLKKSEKIVVLYTMLPSTPENLCKKLQEAGLPAIWIPAPINFKQVERIPVLGTGKMDLKGIKDMAMKLYGMSSESF